VSTRASAGDPDEAKRFVGIGRISVMLEDADVQRERGLPQHSHKTD